MFFKKRKKSAEQIENENRLMWIHEHASYMTYVDDVLFADGRIRIEGPHSTGQIEKKQEVLALDCNGKILGSLLIEEFDVKKQGHLQGSVYTGEYACLITECIRGKREEIQRSSMLVNKDLFCD
ncbi:MAG: hypothetical protein Q4E73_05840 [Lachnospiraceae bacterium]|nr:hypothetical protein [Lachnospiraceae bacterium]